RTTLVAELEEAHLEDLRRLHGRVPGGSRFDLRRAGWRAERSRAAQRGAHEHRSGERQGPLQGRATPRERRVTVVWGHGPKILGTDVGTVKRVTARKGFPYIHDRMGDPARRHRLRIFAGALLLVLATTLVYAPVRRHEFVTYDDSVYVTENAQVLKGLTPEGARWAFTSTLTGNWH